MNEPDFFAAVALPFVKQEEGGYADDPADRGGCTMNGITQVTYNAWLTANGAPIRAVRLIQPDEVEAIYRSGYWAAASCTAMPDAVALVVFDGAVQHGPRKSVELLQTALGVPADGAFGPQSLAALAVVSEANTVTAYCAAREHFYESIITNDPSQKRFAAGWFDRLNRVQALAEKTLAGGE